jgi:hypothetical protein
VTQGTAQVVTRLVRCNAAALKGFSESGDSMTAQELIFTVGAKVCILD